MEQNGPTTLLATDLEAIRHLKQSLKDGTPWPEALLQAIALWASPEETHADRHYQYIIGGEAFDWLLLAERLCDEIGDFISQREKEDLLFQGKFPSSFSPDEFKKLIGPSKNVGYLNHFYGVLVEEALFLAVEEELRKAHVSKGFAPLTDYSPQAYQSLYWESESQLLRLFQTQEGITASKTLTYSQYRSFTYWLFKHRLKTSDPAKVASDTRKGLDMLAKLRSGATHDPAVRSTRN